MPRPIIGGLRLGYSTVFDPSAPVPVVLASTLPEMVNSSCAVNEFTPPKSGARASIVAPEPTVMSHPSHMVQPASPQPLVELHGPPLTSHLQQ